MSNATSTQPTPTTQRMTKLVTLATDLIERHKGEPISHNRHSRIMVELLTSVYRMGYQEAAHSVIAALDEFVIEPIQTQIDKE